MLILVRGAGDLASGIALRLHRSGMQVVMTDLAKPTSVRRTVSFSEAIRLGKTVVEDVTAARADSVEEAREILHRGEIPVMVDPENTRKDEWKPDAIVDAIIAKRNLGTKMTDAPVVVAVGPGFIAGRDAHAVIESQRGHHLGRVIYQGSAEKNTGIPGNIGGYSRERVLRAAKAGIFHPTTEIGNLVHKGEVVAMVDTALVRAEIDGMVRGLLPEGTEVSAEMKCGDIDPRGNTVNYREASDKALAIGGGVLEAVLHFSRAAGI